MKKRPDKHQDQATDIILNDKEMEALINELVQKAYKSGVCITHLNKAISTVWQKTFYVEPEKLNAREAAFSRTFTISYVQCMEYLKKKTRLLRN